MSRRQRVGKIYEYPFAEYEIFCEIFQTQRPMKKIRAQAEIHFLQE